MLEAKIEELTAAVNRLTSALERQSLNPAQKMAVQAAEASTAPLEVVEDLPFDTQPMYREAVRAMCLDLVRKDRGNKQKVKDAIAEAGGKLIDDVPEGNLPALAKAMEAL